MLLAWGSEFDVIHELSILVDGEFDLLGLLETHVVVDGLSGAFVFDSAVGVESDFEVGVEVVPPVLGAPLEVSPVEDALEDGAVLLDEGSPAVRPGVEDLSPVEVSVVHAEGGVDFCSAEVREVLGRVLEEESLLLEELLDLGDGRLEAGGLDLHADLVHLRRQVEEGLQLVEHLRLRLVDLLPDHLLLPEDLHPQVLRRLAARRVFPEEAQDGRPPLQGLLAHGRRLPLAVHALDDLAQLLQLLVVQRDQVALLGLVPDVLVQVDRPELPQQLVLLLLDLLQERVLDHLEELRDLLLLLVHRLLVDQLRDVHLLQVIMDFVEVVAVLQVALVLLRRALVAPQPTHRAALLQKTYLPDCSIRMLFVGTLSHILV